MGRIKNSLRALTRAVCDQLDGTEIPKRPVRTVVSRPDAAPSVALDIDRLALSDLRFSITLGLLQSPEYRTAADVIENDLEMAEGIVIDAGGFLQKPEATNITRALLTNFLWRYLREGERLDWDETRFDETFNELRDELQRKSVVFHTSIALSNVKMDIDTLDFNDELRLLPASIEELERWLNPDQSLGSLFPGRHEWNSQYVDRPAVLHARQTVVGAPRPADLQQIVQLPRVQADDAITALRLALNAPITVILQEHESEGLIALGGRSTSWGWSPPRLQPIVTLNQENAANAVHVRQLLQTSPNIDRLKLPIRRWESSLLRPSLEDKLIDAWISLEALLLGGRTGELSFRATILLAEFLGTSGANRKSIFDSARISYEWRSAIVHGLGTKKLAKRSSLDETVRLTTEYLRSALLKVLDLPSQFHPEKLESDLLSRESEPS